MILIRIIRVIAMAGIQMIGVRDIPVILVLRGVALVVVIAMLHIPVVRVWWVRWRAIQMAWAGEVGMIKVRRDVAVISMKRSIDVIGMPGVGVVIEREIAMRISVIAVVAVGVSMTVEMRRGIRVVAM